MAMTPWVGSAVDPVVVLVDACRSHDDPFVTALATEGFRMVLAKSGEEGLQELFSAEPDLVLVNAHLSDMSGLALLRRIRATAHVPVIVLSDTDEENEAVLALEMGAMDYLHELGRTREAAARMRAALVHFEVPRMRNPNFASESAPPRGILESGPVTVDLGRRLVIVRGERVPMARKEFELLALLVSNAGYVVSTEHILAEVWQMSTPEVNNNLTVHVRRLRAKIETDPTQPRHIVTVRGSGLRFDPEPV